jgi:subtilisin family serine protease
MIPAGIATVASFYNAINWAAKNPQVQIVNISAGIRGFEEEMRPAIEALLSVGVLPVVAVGNEGRDRTRSPGNYNEVVSVGASSQENLVGGISGSGTIIFNNQQYNVPDIVAPGIQVYSAVRGGYEAWDGTSMAAPIVSGVAALILQKRPNISVIELMDELFSTCKKLTGVSPSRQGNGLIQVTAAL